MVVTVYMVISHKNVIVGREIVVVIIDSNKYLVKSKSGNRIR